MDIRERADRIELMASGIDGVMIDGGRRAVREAVEFLLAARGKLEALPALYLDPQ